MFSPFLGLSQSGVGDPGSYKESYTVKDCFKNNQYNAGFKADSLKANYVMKGVRIWRTINLENKQNQALFNSNNQCVEISLFEIIKFGIIEKGLKAFQSDEFSNNTQKVIGSQNFLSKINLLDTVTRVAFDENGNEKREKHSEKTYLTSSGIKSYLIKEDWITNSYNGKTEKYIIGIAPLIFDEQSGKTVPLCWLYYPEWSSLLASFTARNYYSYEAISYRDVFQKRYFISQISKESNVFDRSLKSTYHASDVYLESELIKEKINNAESDLFNH